MELELFHRWGCPYSAKVREFINENGLDRQVKLIEVDESDNAIETLMNLNQSPQVPCLVVDGKPILESRDIINWLDGNLVGNSDSANM